MKCSRKLAACAAIIIIGALAAFTASNQAVVLPAMEAVVSPPLGGCSQSFVFTSVKPGWDNKSEGWLPCCNKPAVPNLTLCETTAAKIGTTWKLKATAGGKYYGVPSVCVDGGQWQNWGWIEMYPNSPLTTPVTTTVGCSNTNLNTVDLKWWISSTGVPTTPVAWPASGEFKMEASIPNNMSLVGNLIYAQMVVRHATFSGFEQTFTNLVAAVMEN